MAQLIEPITIMVGNEEKVGCILMTYQAYPFLDDARLKAEILDKNGSVLFTTILNAITIQDVAKQLNLKLKTDTVDNRKELLTEIMEEDAKDGLYNKLIASETFQNVEWVFQFDDDEPILLAKPLEDTKEFVIRIGNNNTSNIWFYDDNGKTFKIFAREKQIVNTINLK